MGSPSSVGILTNDVYRLRGTFVVSVSVLASEIQIERNENGKW